MHTLEKVQIVTQLSPRRMRTRATSFMCNHSINYVTARSRLFLLRTHAPSARRGGSANSPPIPFASPRRGRVLFSTPFFACLLYRFSILFHQDSVTHLSLFGCPETERKHRRDPAGIDGEHIREDVAPLSGVLLRINRVAPTSKRQITPALLPPS